MSTKPRAARYPGIELSRREIILSEKVRSALQAHAAPQMGGRMRSAEIIFVTAD